MTTETVKADDEAPNVVAQVDGQSSGRHVVFNAHMDTMEAGTNSAWSVPVFKLSKADGRLYGLGMENMKGALAAMCLATTVLYRRRNAWSGRLSMTAVSDEACSGERGAVLLLKSRPDLSGDFMISGEGPGFMDFAVAEKGLLWIDIEVKGPAGHSSRALAGSTAVMKLAALLARLDAINELYATPPAEPGHHRRRWQSRPARFAECGQSRRWNRTQSDRDRCALATRYPATAGNSTKNIEKRIRDACAGDPDISVAITKAWDANWAALQNPLVVELAAAVKTVRGKKPNYVVRLPGSDARRWRDLGVPAVCYGPQPTLSAGIDDYANKQDIVDCAKIYARTALKLMSLGG